MTTQLQFIHGEIAIFQAKGSLTCLSNDVENNASSLVQEEYDIANLP